jgi:hypothetical protein
MAVVSLQIYLYFSPRSIQAFDAAQSKVLTTPQEKNKDIP